MNEADQDPWDTLLSSALRVEERDVAATERALEAVRRHRAKSVLTRAVQASLAACALVAGLAVTLRPPGSSEVSSQVAYDVYSEVNGW